jgi:hypothetical protein
MTAEFCIIHNKKHKSEGGWRFKDWTTENGEEMGWGCAELGELSYPEFIPESLKTERVTFANDMLQSHRGGQLSKEFLEAHPKRAKQMLKDGAITKEEVKNSKYVWKQDVKGVTKKVDAEMLIK